MRGWWFLITPSLALPQIQPSIPLPGSSCTTHSRSRGHRWSTPNPTLGLSSLFTKASLSPNIIQAPAPESDSLKYAQSRREVRGTSAAREVLLPAGVLPKTLPQRRLPLGHAVAPDRSWFPAKLAGVPPKMHLSVLLSLKKVGQ